MFLRSSLRMYMWEEKVCLAEFLMGAVARIFYLAFS